MLNVKMAFIMCARGRPEALVKHRPNDRRVSRLSDGCFRNARNRKKKKRTSVPDVWRSTSCESFSFFFFWILEISKTQEAALITFVFTSTPVPTPIAGYSCYQLISGEVALSVSDIYVGKWHDLMEMFCVSHLHFSTWEPSCDLIGNEILTAPRHNNGPQFFMLYVFNVEPQNRDTEKLREKQANW